MTLLTDIPEPDLSPKGVSARRMAPRLTYAAAAISCFVLLPVGALIWIAVTGDRSAWPHLIANVIPRSTGTTLALLGGVAFVTGTAGVLTAWLVVTYRFPLSRALTWALVIPLAVPTYISAYTFVEFLDYTGPVQTLIRQIGGFSSGRDYWFPEIRSLWGAVIVLSSVLYPYVYLTSRALFLMQSRTASDVARTLGANPLKVFFKVQLPMARPAIAIGLTLVLMETLNDIGAVSYLGVPTLTFSIFDTWLNRGSLAGAAQIACVMLVIVVALIAAERYARQRQRFGATRTTSAVYDSAPVRLSGLPAFFATLVCLLPVLTGAAIPGYVLGRFAARRYGQLFEPELRDALLASVTVAAATAALTVALAFTLSYAVRVARSPFVNAAVRIAALGYAVPGTVLAIGVLIPLAGLDNLVDGFMRSWFGMSTGLLLTGSGAAIVYACSVRFLTMAEGSIDSGFQKLSPHIDMAARTLGRTSGQALRSVLLPMMRPAAATAALLVFIDTIKELSATILLRPFNFNTLATLVYQEASRGLVEEAAMAALVIVAVGIVPVFLLSETMTAGAGRKKEGRLSAP